MNNLLRRLHRKLKIPGYVSRCFTKEVQNTVKTEGKVVPSLRKDPENSHSAYGQPTFFTHPHLLKEGELIPGIPQGDFVERRERLTDLIKAYSRKLDKKLQNHLIVVPASTKKFMSDKIPYTFRQNTEFLYLTGCLEPDSCLVISMIYGRPDRSYLFLRPSDSSAELWEGARTGVKRAPLFFSVQEARSIHELDQFLQSFKTTTKQFSLWFDSENCDYPVISTIMDEFIKTHNFQKVESPTVFIQKLRLIKSVFEINLMQKSCAIASKAINETIMSSIPGISEHELYAKVDSRCRELGAQRLAYPPVIAGGPRANTIHYISNNQLIKDGDLVLMDAGCEYNAFSSDITRTWPINGKFSEAQKIIYEVILALQKDLISNMMSDGYPTLDMLFNRMCMKLGKFLQELGLIKKGVSDNELSSLAYKFCPHHVSHYLGMDVHDTPLIPRGIPVQPGMIITVEPGIYISEHNQEVPEMFRGIAVRIEDDILITNKGALVLTHYCAKEINDIEALLRGK